MKILVYSHVFAPKIGGVEEIARLLAGAFVEAGHATTVATAVGDPEGTVPRGAFRIVRQPSPSALRDLAGQADACLLMGPSLNGGLPARCAGVPLVISHQIGYEKPAGIFTPRAIAQTTKSFIKAKLCRQAFNVFCSGYMRLSSGHDGVVIPNPFDCERFRRFSARKKTADVVFMGRMIPAKGAMLLLESLDYLLALKRRVTATFIGDGLERERLIGAAAKRGLSDIIHFPGALRGDVLAREVARHRVLVVPSIWQEPFGIVALEGMAAGCVVVGTRVGGLPEAIGEAGLVVPPQDSRALAVSIARALDDTALRGRVASAAEVHLSRHTPRCIASAYLDVLERAAHSRPRYFIRRRHSFSRAI